MENKENYCNHCPSNIRGLCCYHSVMIEDYNIVLFNHPCKHLNKKTGRCRVYKKRYRVNPHCLDVKNAIKKGAVPRGCRYIQDYPDIIPETPFKIGYIPNDVPSNMQAKLFIVNSLTLPQIQDIERGDAKLIIKKKGEIT